MSRPTYTANVIVLRKTKLKETDLILTCLAEDGSQLSLVAKGARKPNSTFSSRLELFSCAHVLAVQGKNLDIVKEATLTHDNRGVRTSMERMACASVLCELLSKSTQPHLEVKTLYSLTQRSLECLNKCSILHVNAVVCAALLKTFSYLGFQPELRKCVLCGEYIALLRGEPLAFSHVDGGVVCNNCFSRSNVIYFSPNIINQATFLLFNTFDDILRAENFNGTEKEILQLCKTWSRAQLGINLKSMEFLLSMTL